MVMGSSAENTGPRCLPGHDPAGDIPHASSSDGIFGTLDPDARSPRAGLFLRVAGRQDHGRGNVDAQPGGLPREYRHEAGSGTPSPPLHAARRRVDLVPLLDFCGSRDARLCLPRHAGAGLRIRHRGGGPVCVAGGASRGAQESGRTHDRGGVLEPPRRGFRSGRPS